MRRWRRAMVLATVCCAPGKRRAARGARRRYFFHTSRSTQSLAVQRATGSRYSHMGVVLHRDGKPYVFEAIGTVAYTPLSHWIARGQGGHYVLARSSTALTAPADGKAVEARQCVSRQAL